MPKLVRLLRDMRPWGKGQDAVLPDDLAAKLVKEGDAADLRPFPPPDVAPSQPLLRPKRYITRKRG